MADPYLDTLEGLRHRREAMQANELARRAGGMIAAGDTTGARNALYSGGALEQGGQLDERMATQQKAKAEAMAKYGHGVATLYQQAKAKGASDQQAAEAAWSVGETYAPRLGLDPKDIADDRAHFLADPTGYLTLLSAQVKQHLQVVPRGQGGYDVVDLEDPQGKAIRSVEPNPEQAVKLPFGWEIGEDGLPHPIPSFVKGKAQLAGAVRAPRRGRSGGGGGGYPGLPPGYRPK